MGVTFIFSTAVMIITAVYLIYRMIYRISKRVKANEKKFKDLEAKTLKELPIFVDMGVKFACTIIENEIQTRKKRLNNFEELLVINELMKVKAKIKNSKNEPKNVTK